MDYSELLDRCEAWHEAEEYEKIVEALEAIPEEERTTDIDMELARAYNNLGDSGDIKGRRLLKKALRLMESHETELSDDYSWNFRMGYALIFLEREGEALPHFEKALELHPGDDPKYNTREEIQTLIDSCRECMALPMFEMTFRTRVARAWEEFSKEEAEIRRMMDSDRRDDYSEELIRRIQDILEIALDDPAFEFGIDEGKHDLVLVAQGDKARLFEYVYFRDHAPESVLENWKITVGRPPRPGFHLRAFDLDVCGDDVDVWAERTEEDRVTLRVRCDKVQDSIEDEDNVWWMLFTVVDNFIGEVANMRQVESFEVVDDLPEGQPIRLSDLPKAIEDLGIVLTNDADSYLKRCTVYKTEPNRESEGPWRLDIISGSNCCPPIVNDYYSGERRCVDTLHADGAVAGYIAYSLDIFDGDDGSDRIFDFRDSLEEALIEKAGEDAITVIGGATGLYYGYLDLIAWDIPSVLSAAQEFLTGSGVSESFFRVFSMDVPTCLIANNRDGDADIDLDGIDYIPYNPKDPEPFYDQIAKWNEEDEYSRCIAVLGTIPEELRDYRSEYALVRALQNYAVIGDHDEGTPGYKADKALRHSLEILESIRDDPDMGGKLTILHLNRMGAWFTQWYNWGDRSNPYEFLRDVKDYADAAFVDREWRDEEEMFNAYLLLPWSERYLDDMTDVIDGRYGQWLESHPQVSSDPADDGFPDPEGWEGARDCAVSEAVLSGRSHMGFCVRWTPEKEDRGWDSGWRFFADDDDDTDEGRLMFRSLGFACDLFPEVRRILDLPYGTAFIRGEDEMLHPYEDDEGE